MLSNGQEFEELISESDIQKRVSELGSQITQDFKKKGIEELLLILVLKGALYFGSALSQKIQIPHFMDFMSVSSYSKTKSSGEVRILLDTRIPLKDKHVILIEDIRDTGLTMEFLLRLLRSRNPASLHTCVLLQKEIDDAPDISIDYLGFSIPDYYVIGFGLDMDESYRWLTSIRLYKEK